MMFSWKQYMLSIVVCSVSCGILSRIVSDTAMKKVMHLICGTILTVSLIAPLSEVDLAEFLQIPTESWNEAEFYISEGKKAGQEVQERCITEACEEYILNKAKVFGADMTVDIALDASMAPYFAEITGAGDAAVQMQLQSILTMDLGIPKENQKWIWNQESSSS